ncbi:MAG: alpha/beta hydrolase [Cyanobacteria bacterium P01_E01_bin.6]
MSNSPHGLWLFVSPGFRRFNQPVLARLNEHVDIRVWQFSQTADEPCCIETVLDLVHDYVSQQSEPLHLLGHSLSGVVALLYARRYPERVKSLTLLSVDSNPVISWHVHYYSLREMLPCNRKAVLYQMVRLLFGPQSPRQESGTARLLGKILDTEFTLHSLAQRHILSPGGIEVPLLVCHGESDMILDSNSQIQWNHWLKPGDRRWTCAEGRHFFHYEYPTRVRQTIVDFWQHSSQPSSMPLIQLAS